MIRLTLGNDSLNEIITKTMLMTAKTSAKTAGQNHQLLP